MSRFSRVDVVPGRLSLSGVWLLAWTVSAAPVVGTVARKIPALLVADEDFRVSEDVGVYQDAVVAMTHGITLYQVETFRIGAVNFIYPPFAGLLMAPMAYIDTWALVVLRHLLLVGCLAFGVWAVARAEGLEGPMRWAAALVGPLTVTYVVTSNTSFGQINLVLMALVFADLFGIVPARFRGVGIGVAAAIKLTPLGFVLVLMVRRDWWSVLRALGVTAASVALGFLLPGDSQKFWSTIAWDQNRGGMRVQAENQSTDPLLRSGLDMHMVDLLYPFLVVLLVAAVAWAAWGFHLKGWEVASVGIVGLGIVYCAPMSVQHHWFVVVLVPVMLVSTRYSSIAPWLVGVVALAFVDPVEWFRRKDWAIRVDLPWPATLLEAVVSLGALTLIVASAVAATRDAGPATKQLLGSMRS